MSGTTTPTSAPTTDRERLTQAREVIHGGEADRSASNAVYAAYVAVIASLVYGVPASRAFFIFVDPAWLSRHLTGVQGVLVIGATYFIPGFFSNGTIGAGGVANEASIASFLGATFNTDGSFKA